LRHLCARRFPGIPFLLLANEGEPAGRGTVSQFEARQRIKRLL